MTINFTYQSCYLVLVYILSSTYTVKIWEKAKTVRTFVSTYV